MKKYIFPTLMFSFFFFFLSTFIYPLFPFEVNRWIADPLVALSIYLLFFRKVN